jgi:hypothetical protein
MSNDGPQRCLKCGVAKDRATRKAEAEAKWRPVVEAEFEAMEQRPVPGGGVIVILWFAVSAAAVAAVVYITTCVG